MNDALIVTLLSMVPKHRTARLIGAGARTRLPAAAQQALLRWYVRTYDVDLSECVGGIEDYASLSEFFLRPLKPGVRPVDPRPDHMVSPVDARAHSFGTISGGTFPQSETLRGTVAGLIGDDDPRVPPGSGPRAADFEGGPFAILYLSPRDYHRVHVPLDVEVTGYRYLPGKLWPVFPAATRKIDDLFGRNERLVFFFDTEHFGRMAMIMVGAFGVGRMSTSVASLTTHVGNPAEARHLDPAVPYARAAELGRFELGSTVILVGEQGAWDWDLEPGQDVRLGQPIARSLRPPAPTPASAAPPSATQPSTEE